MKIKNYDELPLLMTVKDLSAVMGISIPTAYELTRRSGFPALKVGERRIVIPKDSFRQWLDSEARKERPA